MADLFGEAASLLQGATAAASNSRQNDIAAEAERNKLFMGGQTNLTALMQRVMADQASMREKQLGEAGATQRQGMAGQTALQQEGIQQAGGLAKQGMEDAAKEKANTITIDAKTAKLAAKAYGIPELAEYADQSMPLNKWSAIQKAAADDLAARTKESMVDGKQGGIDQRAEKNRYRNYFLDLESRDVTIKKARENGINADIINTLTGLVKEGNTVAFAALGIKMAKGMGEVGVMTEEDIARYVRSGQLTRKAADIWMKWKSGVATQATLTEIAEITNAVKDDYQSKIQPRYNQFIDTYSSIEGITPQEFSQKIKLPYTGGQNPNGGAGGGNLSAQEQAEMAELEKRFGGGK